MKSISQLVLSISLDYPSLSGVDFTIFGVVKIYGVDTVNYPLLLNCSNSTHHTSTSINSVQDLPDHIIDSDRMSLLRIIGW